MGLRSWWTWRQVRKRQSRWTEDAENPETGWLADRMKEGDDCYTGFDVGGWEDSIFVLHPMWVRDDIDPDASSSKTYGTNDNREQADRPPGQGPDILESLGIDDLDVSGLYFSSVFKDWAEPPGEAWRRVSWGEVASRYNIKIGSEKYPPCFHWLDELPGVESVLGPNEGTFDELTFRNLAKCLVGDSWGESKVNAWWAPYWTAMTDVGEVETRFLRQSFGQVGDTIRSVQLGQSKLTSFATPSNMWPDDRSWFTATDVDAMGTKVSGSKELIARLEAESNLDTIRWPEDRWV